MCGMMQHHGDAGPDQVVYSKMVCMCMSQAAGTPTPASAPTLRQGSWTNFLVESLRGSTLRVQPWLLVSNPLQ